MYLQSDVIGKKVFQNESHLSAEEVQLFLAVESGDTRDVKSSLRTSTKNLNLDRLNEIGYTVLGTAAKKGDVDKLQCLLQAGCQVNQCDFYGQTSLHHAVDGGHVEAVRLLLNKGSSVQCQDATLSALHIAAIQGHTYVAKMLIDAGCNINAKDINGVPVLHCAVGNGHQEIVLALLKAGAHTNTRNLKTGQTAVFIAIDTNNVELLRLLLSRGAKVNVRDQCRLTPLCLACLRDNTVLVQLLLEHRAKVNMQDASGHMPLHYAARNGNVTLTKLFIQQGSRVDDLGQSESALHLAVKMEHVEIVKALVTHGCDTNICEGEGHLTVLHYAVTFCGRAGMFALMLELLVGADCRLDDHHPQSQETALYRAVELGKTDPALLLLQSGADVNVDCPHDFTVLHKACQRRNLVVVESLLHSPIDWSRERWLDHDIFSSGINLKLLSGYVDHGVPMVLLSNVELYYAIQEVRHNAQSLLGLCRRTLRRTLSPRLQEHVALLPLPNKLHDYLMLRIL